MKKIILPAIILSLFITSCGGDADNELKALIEEEQKQLELALEETEDEIEATEDVADDLFSSEDGKFKINFTGTPTESSDIVPTDVGDIEMTSFMYEKSLTEAYMVAYNDYPSEMVKMSSVDDLLDGAKNGSSSSLGINEFEIDKNMEIEGNPGRHFKGTNGTYYAEYKLFLKGSRLYQIALIRDGSYATQERSEEFFSSFELIE
jgi:hypothetical protein